MVRQNSAAGAVAPADRRQSTGREHPTAIVSPTRTTVNADVERLASLILAPGMVIEVRAFTREGYVNRGYFDNVDDMLKAVEAIDQTGRYAGIYWTINPVNPALLARAANRIDTSRGRKTSTGDDDIIRRKYVYIDLDPERPSGIAATDEEHRLAIERATKLRDWLLLYGIPAVLVNTGNGGMLLVPVDLPNDAESTHLVSDILKVMGQEFGGDGIKIDQSVSNASRIARIPGTVNRKGDHTEDRPHRRAQIIDMPDDLTPVPLKTLEWIRGQLKPNNDDHGNIPTETVTSSGSHFDVEGFIGRAGLAVSKKEPYQGGMKWELEVCPFNPEHTDRSAWIIQFGNGAVSAGCHHDGCTGKGWQELRSMFDPVYAERQRVRQSAAEDFSSSWAADETTPAGNDERFEMAGPNNPWPNAKMFIDKHYTHNGVRTIIHTEDEFQRWSKDRPSYQRVEPVTLDAQLYRFARHGYYLDLSKPEFPKAKNFNPNRTSIGMVSHAVRAKVHISKDIDPPAWIGSTDSLPPAKECIPFRNGILHTPTRRLMSITPRFYTPYHLDFDYDPGAPEPETWLTFLDSIWPNDPQTIGTLQEYMGLLMTLDTSFQKGAMFYGPPRAGKGVITGTIRELVGSTNFASLTLSKFATNFGLQSAIGKSVIAVPDARLSGRADMTQIVENLLAITGEDVITIDRKHREPWQGRLPARLLVMTNELPRFQDASGALANRFIILRMTKSFLGNEDRTLPGRIRQEIPSIMLWALDGLDRLQARGYLVQPDAGAGAVSMMKDITSPVTTFVNTFCDLGPELVTPRNELYSYYRDWLRARGVKNLPADNTFGRDLLAAFPSIEREGPRVRQADGSRPRTYQGIGFKPDAVAELKKLKYGDFLGETEMDYDDPITT